MQTETKYKIALVVMAGIMAGGYLWDKQEAPKPGPIQEAIQSLKLASDSVVTLNFVTDSWKTPVILDSLKDAKYKLKSIRWLGLDSLRRSFYEVQFVKEND